jgi:hypothetical protein
VLCKHGWPVEQAGRRPGGPTREDKVTFEECEIPCPPSRAGTHVVVHVMDTDSGIKKVEEGRRCARRNTHMCDRFLVVSYNL